MIVYLNRLSLTMSADPELSKLGVQGSDTCDLMSLSLAPSQSGNLTHNTGYSVAYSTEQSISIVPPILVMTGGLMYEMVGVLCAEDNPKNNTNKIITRQNIFQNFYLRQVG